MCTIVAKKIGYCSKVRDITGDVVGDVAGNLVGDIAGNLAGELVAKNICYGSKKPQIL
jgi:hypothetical protein